MKINKKIFFDNYRQLLDKNLSQFEVDNLDKFIDHVNGNSLYFTLTQWAYVFATVFHETAYTFSPLREAPQKTEEWRKRNLRYYPYYGRGHVQLTWLENYKKFSKLLGLDLVKFPDEAMNFSTSFKILSIGFKNGLFSGKKISDYINDKKKDYKNARRCINILDKAETISDYAKKFELILIKSSIK